MDFQQVLERRYSCRQYDARPVEREKIDACLEAGRVAPSGCNSQRWVFIAVDDPALRAQLAGALYDPELAINGFAGDIPVLVALVKHPPRKLNAKQEKILGTADLSDIDIGIAAQQICLAATNEGLGSVMMGWFDEQQVRETLGIPGDMQVPLLIGIGYPKDPEERRHTTRYPSEEIIRWNGFQKGEA